MLKINRIEDLEKMNLYYRTRDMINLMIYFPDICPIEDLVIITDEEDYKNNIKNIKGFNHIRVDSLQGRGLINNIEVSKFKDVLSVLKMVKEKDPLGVIVLFKLNITPSERYERYAGISIRIDIGEGVVIEAVGRGFDGREVTKNICVHERYYIPWTELGRCSILTFKEYQIYQVNDIDYSKSRKERIAFLKRIGLKEETFSKCIPYKYEEVPTFIWFDIIKNILKKLEKKEEILLKDGFKHFSISGHTEGDKFFPWQMFDKKRYD